MPVDLRAKMEMSPRLKEAMAKAPDIVAEELTEGMKEVAHVRDTVRSQIQAEGLVESGLMMRSTRAMVFTNRDRANVRGIVDVGKRGGFYAGVHEHGATIRPKRGKYLVIPVGEKMLVTHTQPKRDGAWRELKSPRIEMLTQDFRKVKSVTIKPTWYFFRSVQKSLPRVEAALDRHAYTAMQRVFEVGDVSGN